MSYADVVLFDVLGRMTDADDAVFSKFEAVAPDNGRMVWALDGDAYPKVKAMLAEVGENEGIKKYLDSREKERGDFELFSRIRNPKKTCFFCIIALF